MEIYARQASFKKTAGRDSQLKTQILFMFSDWIESSLQTWAITDFIHGQILFSQLSCTLSLCLAVSTFGNITLSFFNILHN